MRLGLVAATLLSAVGLCAAYAAGAFGGGSHPHVAQGAPPPPSPAELRMIERLALRQAAAAGDPDPSSGVVVPTTRQIAERVGAGDPTEPSTPAYFVLLHGEFTGNEAPAGAALPTGSILTMTIDAKRNTVTDGGIEDRMPDLDAIGRAVQLTLPDLAAGAPSLTRDLALTKHVACGAGRNHLVGPKVFRRFHAVTAVLCTEGFRVFPGQGQWEVLVRKVATGGVAADQRYFEQPSEPDLPKNGFCTANLVVLQVPTFVDAGGHVLVPRTPIDRCHHPLGLPPGEKPMRVRWHVVWVHRIKQLITAAAVAAHCPMRVGNTVAWAGPREATSGGRCFPGRPRPSASASTGHRRTTSRPATSSAASASTARRPVGSSRP